MQNNYLIMELEELMYQLTLKTKTFKFLTRRGDLDQVLKGIDKALEVGLKIKINTVALKETNEFELNDILKWAHSKKC